ncbi:Uu.00g083330.m01.CDS01 [Anthostomella pinea]|uniref:Uu.00g083330.m01.CDS01 n=1 Tax=Anthostomella pinea TaxID=933095 RepID=A0AAI8VM58_9PEZI|nr:Uu.00g083330.m01.CDS01 [Anthostomella pinea]
MSTNPQDMSPAEEAFLRERKIKFEKEAEENKSGIQQKAVDYALTKHRTNFIEKQLLERQARDAELTAQNSTLKAEDEWLRAELKRRREDAAKHTHTKSTE